MIKECYSKNWSIKFITEIALQCRTRENGDTVVVEKSLLQNHWVRKLSRCYRRWWEM